LRIARLECRRREAALRPTAFPISR
jgi:hypothetical protein